MKRRGLLKLAVFLLLGAAVNVAVAWMCFWFGSWSNIDVHSVDATGISHRFRWSNCCARKLSLGSAAECVGGNWFNFGIDEACGGSTGDALVDVRCGWPLRALVGQWCLIDDSHFGVASIAEYWPTHHQPVLPIVMYAPLWPGFAINTIFYAGVCWLLFAAPFAVRRRLRLRRGLCAYCAYPIGTSDLCTECGKPVSLGALNKSPDNRQGATQHRPPERVLCADARQRCDCE